MHIIFTNIHIYNEIFKWFTYGLILPIVLGGVSQLPTSDNAYDVDVEFDIESDVKSKKPLEQAIGLPSNMYNLSL
jgi:hypothetical protein